MAEIVLDGVAGPLVAGRPLVQDVSLQVADGEVMALLGPSGSGKTTVLRLVAGLDRPSAGSVHIGGEPVDDVPTHERDLALVTEEHSLLAHLDVERNIGFSLRLRRLPPAEIGKRVHTEARVFGLQRLLRRLPRTLSAGQQQAASVARATVRVPSAYLLDEPLSRIDARERLRLRGELARYVRGLGVTTLLATNDQGDALSMADRVAVLRGGRLQQVDTPEGLYRRPASAFVAAFVGDPGMNVMRGTLEAGATVTLVRFGEHCLPLDGVPGALRSRLDGQPVLLGVRPEHLAMQHPPGDGALAGVVDRVEHLGADALVTVQIEAPGQPRAVVRVRSPSAVPAAGEAAGVALRSAEQHLFDDTTGEALWHAGG